VPAALAADLLEDIAAHRREQPQLLRQEWAPLIERLEAMRQPEELQFRPVAEIELEDFRELHGLQPVSMAGASGGKAVVLRGADSYAATTVRLSRNVHRLRVRGCGPRLDSDAFFLSLSGCGERRAYMPKPEWCEADAIIFDLNEAGEFELRLRTAEPNVVIDKVTIEAAPPLATEPDGKGVAAGAMTAALVLTGTGPNYVINGDFEHAAGNVPAEWALARTGIGDWTLDDAVRHSGGFSARLTPRILPDSVHKEHAIQQPLSGPRLPPAGQHIFQVWVRVSSDYSGALPTVAVNHYGKNTRNWYVARLEDGTPRDQWVRLRTMVHLPEDTTGVYVQLKAYGERGSVWFDDVSLHACSASP
jgi:hypothetical protein